MAPKTKKAASSKRAAKPKPRATAKKKPVTFDGAKARARGPRSEPLPGMEQTRDRILDHACEEIAESRANQASERQREQHSTSVAMQRMATKPKNERQYRHAGVELAFVPGVDKLRIRLTKDAENTITPTDVGDGESFIDDAGNLEVDDLGGATH